MTQRELVKSFIKGLGKTISKTILVPLMYPFRFVFPKGRTIIIQTYNSRIYCENTKYLYEYLSRNSDYKIYWVTENNDVKKYLRERGLRYISRRNPLSLLRAVLRASVVIDSGSSYFNFLGLIGKKVVKICTMHGNGPKTTTSIFDSLRDNLREVVNMNQFDYVNFGSKYAAVMIGKLNMKLPHHKVIHLGFPRVDQYFDVEHTQKARQERKWAKKLNSHIVRTTSKVILYTPTWRSYSYEFPLRYMDGFSIESLHEFLKKNDLYFFYTLHTARKLKNLIPSSERIRFVGHHNSPFFDTNEFMMEADVLLNDYSNTSTDFSILNRPQVFFMPDYDQYFEQKGFIEEYRSILPGREVFNFQDLVSTLLSCLESSEGYVNQYRREKDLLLERYYDTTNRNSCENFKNFIEGIFEKNNRSHAPGSALGQGHGCLPHHCI